MLAHIVSLSNKKAGKWVKGRKEVWAHLNQQVDPNSSYIWVHCASLGEFEQGRPLIERIKAKDPSQKILVTFFSPSGYEVRKNFELADVVLYLPLDTKKNAQRLLSTINIRKAYFIKYEFWYYFLNELHRRSIDTYLVSGIFRPSQIFFKPYGKWYARILHNFTFLYLQNEISKDLLQSIGIHNTQILGDTRFDRVHDIALTANDLPLVETFKQNQKVIVCGSTWPEDEAVLLDYVNESKNIKWIIAPHEVSESHILSLKDRLTKKSVFFSNLKEEDPSQFDIIIADGYGYLTSLYKYADIAYVGGGFGKSIHNILEAATFGAPIVFGPKHSKFKEAVDLIDLKGSFNVHNKDEVKGTINHLLESSDSLQSASTICRKYVAENTGATDVILKETF
ncbi:glycosyltransferase N-terminal domain-containing protein [Prolixibacteraceae bacterium]|nr:glycosyltransferase N-terminal domain-containing protein [Prolixibacteraceae bacterium]